MYSGCIFIAFCASSSSLLSTLTTNLPPLVSNLYAILPIASSTSVAIFFILPSLTYANSSSFCLFKTAATCECFDKFFLIFSIAFTAPVILPCLYLGSEAIPIAIFTSFGEKFSSRSNVSHSSANVKSFSSLYPSILILFIDAPISPSARLTLPSGLLYKKYFIPPLGLPDLGSILCIVIFSPIPEEPILTFLLDFTTNLLDILLEIDES